MYNSANVHAADTASAFSEFMVERTVSEWNARFQKLRWEALMGDEDNAARRFLFGVFPDSNTFATTASDNFDDHDAAASVSPPPGHLITQDHPLISSPSSTTQYQSFSSASSAFSDYSPSIAFHESQQVSYTGIAQEQLPDPSPFPHGSFSSTRMSFADGPMTDANRGRKRPANASSGPLPSSSFDSTAEIDSVPKRRHIRYDYADDTPVEYHEVSAAAELSTPVQPVTSSSSNSSNNNKDAPAAMQYCNIHGRSRHSTEECRASQAAALRLGSSTSPTDAPTDASGKMNRANKYCDYHGCIGHTTEECRLRTKAMLKALHPSQSKDKGKGNGNSKGNSKGKGNSKNNDKGKGNDKGKSNAKGNAKGKTMSCPRCSGKTSGKGHRCNGKLAAAHLHTQKGKPGKPVRAKKASTPVKSSSAGRQSASEA